MKKIYEVHECKFVRSGKCKRCGSCEKPDCPHFSMEDGLATCKIHDKKPKVCKDFPDHPFLRVIKSGVCGYKFEPLTVKDAKKYKELKKAWQ